MQPVLLILGLGGLVGLVIGWGLWLEHRRSQALLAIIRAAVERGDEPPPEVLDALSGKSAGNGRLLSRAAALAFAAAAAALLASFLIGEPEKERMLLLSALILLAAGAASLVIRLFGRRLGL